MEDNKEEKLASHIEELPEQLKHLPIYRGYPVPYFVAYVDGKPDFRTLDQRKQISCLQHNLCAVCGKKLVKGVYWFISGPMGLKNKVSSDPAMHEECARWSLKICPHLHFKKHQRREDELTQELATPYMIRAKPEVMNLIKSDKQEVIRMPEGTLISYRPTYIESYSYADNILTLSSAVPVSR